MWWKNFLDAVFFVLEQFVAPQETIYAYLALEFPSLFSFVFDSIGLVLLAIGVLLVCVGVSTSIVMDLRSASGGAGFGIFLMVVAVMLVFGLLFVSGSLTNGGLARLLTVLLLGASILLAKVCLGYSAYKSGYWSGKNMGVFLLAVVVAIRAAYLISRHGAALLASSLLVGGSIAVLGGEILEGMINYHPMMAMGVMLLAAVGVVFEPEFVRCCLELVDLRDVSPEHVCLLVGYWCFGKVLFGLSFVPGLIIGAVERVVGLWTNWTIGRGEKGAEG
jgi:hypothetical protein